MSRRNRAVKREVLPDPLYNSTLVTKIINQVMKDGKKGIAQSIVYSAMKNASEKLNDDAMNVLTTAIENIKPKLETKARRVGGANYQVPLEVSADRQQTLAIRWLVMCARKRNERGMQSRLGAEIVDAFNQTGGAIKKRDDMHRQAEANKAFAHFRW
ncbi:MAG TPA: 30S ribosomal protein S7 [Candidatus Onthoplasma faecipullorum]|nr:30S ribosomal protein S7 [Candidatus Onthoplasma faecipullorum]